MKDLAHTAETAGFRRPQVHFETGEALRRAFRLKTAEERKNIHGIAGQIARANAEQAGGTDEDRNLFQAATDAHARATSAYSAYAPTGPHCWKRHLGEAELYLNRAETLQEEAWSLIAADGVSLDSPPAATKSAGPVGATPPAAAAADAGADDDVNPAITPIDLRMLDVFIKRIREQGPAMADQAGAACVCLAAAIESLHEAVANFDKAIGLNPDLVEAYRDRGLGYYRLAQCEAILAAVEDSDLTAQSGTKAASPVQGPAAQNLDRALVDGRKRFDKAIKHLVEAREAEAFSATQMKDIASAEEAMAKNFVTAAIRRGDSPAKGQKKAETRSTDKTDLPMVGEKLRELRIEAAALEKRAERDEEKAARALLGANAELTASYDVLNNSGMLQQAKRSAQVACEKGNFASAESLKNPGHDLCQSVQLRSGRILSQTGRDLHFRR